ncbi:thymidine kinase [Kocuria himachalensis]
MACLFVDEARFLSSIPVEDLFLITVEANVPVRAYGLRTGFRAEPLSGAARLLALAHGIEEIQTNCRCGSKAISTGAPSTGRSPSTVPGRRGRRHHLREPRGVVRGQLHHCAEAQSPPSAARYPGPPADRRRSGARWPTSSKSARTSPTAAPRTTPMARASWPASSTAAVGSGRCTSVGNAVCSSPPRARLRRRLCAGRGRGGKPGGPRHDVSTVGCPPAQARTGTRSGGRDARGRRGLSRRRSTGPPELPLTPRIR